MSGQDTFTELTGSITWPSFLPTLGDDSFLQHLYVQPLDTTFSATDVGLSTQVLVDEPVSFTIPGLDAVAIGIASQGGGTLIRSLSRSPPRSCCRSTAFPSPST